jgi:hypothetical protein
LEISDFQKVYILLELICIYQYLGIYSEVSCMKKKAQGLSLNTVIIAAIVLIVLVVLWAIFTGRMGAFNKGLDEQQEGLTCDSAAIGGVVQDADAEGGCPTGSKIAGSFNLADGKICCTQF